LYVLLKPFRLLVTVNEPSALTEARIQWPWQSADSSTLAIISSAVLDVFSFSSRERCPCQIPSMPGVAAIR